MFENRYVLRFNTDDLDFVEIFKLTEERIWNYVDGEEGDSGIIGYYKDGQLFGVYVNYAGDDEDSILTEYGITCVKEYIKDNLESVLGFYPSINTTSYRQIVEQMKAIGENNETRKL